MNRSGNGRVIRSPSLRTEGSEARKPHIFAFAPNEWDGPWMNRQQILSRLARRGWPVTYSTGALSVWDRQSDAFRAAPLLRQYHASSEGVSVEQPGKLLLRWQRLEPYDRWVVRRHASALHRHAQDSNGHAIAYIFHPGFAPYEESLRCRWTVYHAFDLFSMQPGWTEELATLERSLIQRADLVIAGNAATLEKIGANTARSIVLPNGADAPAFAAGSSLPCPADLAEIPRPRIGYVGRINRKVDFATIAAVARAKPDWHWVLVGPVQTTGMGAPDQDPQIAESYRASRQLSNVHFLGSKTHTDLPAYVGHMDVNTLCYRPDEGWWRFGSPLKLHEYLATGRPVVGTGLPDLMAFAGVIAVARSTEEWQRALEGALADRSPQAVDVRRHVASANSWDKRVDELEQHLRAMIAGDVDVREPATRSAASAN